MLLVPLPSLLTKMVSGRLYVGMATVLVQDLGTFSLRWQGSRERRMAHSFVLPLSLGNGMDSGSSDPNIARQNRHGSLPRPKHKQLLITLCCVAPVHPRQ